MNPYSRNVPFAREIYESQTAIPRRLRYAEPVFNEPPYQNRYTRPVYGTYEDQQLRYAEPVFNEPPYQNRYTRPVYGTYEEPRYSIPRVSRVSGGSPIVPLIVLPAYQSSERMNPLNFSLDTMKPLESPLDKLNPFN